MTMNSILNLGDDTVIVFLGVTLSFLVGAALRISRSLAHERREVDRLRCEVREVGERCDLQQMNLMRLGQVVEELRSGAVGAACERAVSTPVALPQSAVVRAARQAPPPVPVREPAAAAPAAEPRPVARTRQSPTPTPTPAPGREAAAPASAAPRAPSAFELARTGAGLKAIMQVCGLSRAEAELVLSVHGRGAAA